MEQIWWERVPNATLFIRDICACLLEEKSVVIQYADNIPWRNYLKGLIKDTVNQDNSLKRFEILNYVKEPGPYALREYCKEEKRTTYRPSETYATFLACSDDIVFHERYLWVKIESTENLDRWTEFISEYLKERAEGKDRATFILEWNGNKTISKKKGLRTFAIDDYITEYDFEVYTALATSSIKEKSFIKKYLAELAVDVTGNNIELCSKCIEQYFPFLAQPYSQIINIVNTEHDEEGNAFKYYKTNDEVRHLIWLAQIKTIYPLIENYREEFVADHYKDIMSQLPISSTYGETYSDPKEVELGTLMFMSAAGKLYLSRNEYEELKRYKEARNKLSHLNILTIDEIKILV